MVARLASGFRVRLPHQAVCSKPKRHDLSPRQAAMLMAKRPEIVTMNTLMKGFNALLREGRAEDFQTWSADAIASGLPEMKRFCEGLERDRAAVLAAIELPWSNGQVEGQVHRLKLIKRQMYGRAAFPLLRSRVLPFHSHLGAAAFGKSP